MKVRRAEYWMAASQPRELPEAETPEVAFLGRSNVGKSSLLNKLVARKQLARTSSTPGKTRLIHFYRVEIGTTPVTLVDLPGYGYAKVSRAEREKWKRLIEGYLGDRPALRAAVLLQDLRRDVSDDETLLLEWLAERDVPWLVALTKCDKLKPMRRAKRIKEVRQQFGTPATHTIATSSEKGFGIDELWKAIHRNICADEEEAPDAAPD